MSQHLVEQSNAKNNKEVQPKETKPKSVVPISLRLAGFILLFIFIINMSESLRSLYSLKNEDENKKNIPLQWSNDAVCHTPIKAQIGAVPPLNNTKETRIVNVGMPKSGSTSTKAIFKKSRFHTSHWLCGDFRTGGIKKFCGNCIDHYAHLHNESLFEKCGDFHVWTQLDHQTVDVCIYPQIEYLEELYLSAPNATWLMPMRNVTAWVNSVGRWSNLRERFGKCDFRPHLNFTQGDAETDEKMMELYCTHIDQVRDFVKTHPTLSYIEYRIEDSDVGSYLKEHFPSLSESQWEQTNKNTKIED